MHQKWGKMIWTTSSNVLQASTDFGPPKNSQAARMFSGNVSDCIQAPSATRPSYWSMRDLPNRVFKANIFKYGPTWRLLFFFSTRPKRNSTLWNLRRRAKIKPKDSLLLSAVSKSHCHKHKTKECKAQARKISSLLSLKILPLPLTEIRPPKNPTLWLLMRTGKPLVNTPLSSPVSFKVTILKMKSPIHSGTRKTSANHNIHSQFLKVFIHKFNSNTLCQLIDLSFDNHIIWSSHDGKDSYCNILDYETVGGNPYTKMMVLNRPIKLKARCGTNPKFYYAI